MIAMSNMSGGSQRADSPVLSQPDARLGGRKMVLRPEHKPDDAPKKGDHAPDFTLRTLDGEDYVTLSDYRGDKPVVLVFGSYT